MKKSHLHLTTHRLSRPIRLTIMILLIASFFIISPSIILYIAGYRYDLRAHEIRQTGVLNIDIEPKNATVWLNDIVLDKNIPIRLSNRAPGTYQLNIEKDGYKSWKKNISIESNQTTYINDIILIKEPITQPLDISFNKLVGIYGTQSSDVMLIVSEKNNVYDIMKYDSTKDITIPVLRNSSHTPPIINISPYHNIAAIQIFNKNETVIHLISLDTTESISTFYFDALHATQWLDNRFEPLIVQTDTELITLSQNKSQQTLHQTTAPIWYVDDSQTLWHYVNGEIIHIGSSEKFAITQLDNIIHINNDRIVTQYEDTISIISRTHDFQTITLDAQHTYYNQNNNQIIAWSPWEVSIIYEDGSVNLINRTGDDIHDIKIFDENNTLMFVTKYGIKIFDPRYYIGYDFLSDEIIHIFAATKKRELIYMNPQDNKLYKTSF